MPGGSTGSLGGVVDGAGFTGEGGFTMETRLRALEVLCDAGRPYDGAAGHAVNKGVGMLCAQ